MYLLRKNKLPVPAKLKLMCKSDGTIRKYLRREYILRDVHRCMAQKDFKAQVVIGMDNSLTNFHFFKFNLNI